MKKSILKIVCLILISTLLVSTFSGIGNVLATYSSSSLNSYNGNFEEGPLKSNQTTVLSNTSIEKAVIERDGGNHYLVLPVPDNDLPSGKKAYSFAHTITGLNANSEYYISFRFKCENTSTGWAFMAGLFDNTDSLGGLPYPKDWGYITPVSGKVLTGGALFSNNSDYGGIISNVTSTDWQYITIKFQPIHAWTSLVITPYLVSTGAVCIDDIIVANTEVSGGLIKNGDFENGTYSSWNKTETVSACQIISDIDDSDNNILSIPAKGTKQQRNVYQKAGDLVIGKKYVLSFRMKYFNITANELSWQNFVGISTVQPDFTVAIYGNIEPEIISYTGTEFTAQQIGQDSTGLMKVGPNSSTEWQTYTIEFIADTETAYFYFTNYYAKADVFLDDVALNLDYQKYDVNCDDTIDVRDLVRLKKHLTNLYLYVFNTIGADIDENDKVDTIDLVFLRQQLLGVGYSDIRTLSFDTTTATYENYGGVSALYSGYHFHPDGTWRGYTDDELQWEVEQVLDSGVSFVRANFYVSWTWDYIKNCYDYNTEDMQAFYRYAQLLKENGINIGIVLNDTIYESFDTRKTPFVLITGGTDHDECAAEMGKFASDFVNEVILDRGFSNVEYIEMFTEPGNDYFDSNHTTAERKAEFDKDLKYYKAVHEQLTKDGLRDKIKIMGSNVAMHHLVEPYITYALDWLDWSIEFGDEYIDVYSMHTYSRLSYTSDDYSAWIKFINYAKTAIKPTGKKFFIDEFGYGYNDGISGNDPNGKLYNQLTGIHLTSAYVAMMNSGFVEGGTIWSLADEKWPGRYNTSTQFTNGIQTSGYSIPNLRLSNVLKPNYYLISVLGKAVQGGCDVYAASSKRNGVYSTYIINVDGSKSVVVVNIGRETSQCVFDFDTDINVSSLYRYEYGEVTNASSIIQSAKVITQISGRFIDVIPSLTAVIYTSSELN